MMRVTIAGHSFYLQASEVEHAMNGVEPEPVSGESVRIGLRTYPVKQVGAVVTRQDRRDFSAAEMSRALRRLGFICHEPPPAPKPGRPVPEIPDFGPDQVLPTSGLEPAAAAEHTAPPAIPPTALGFLDAARRPPG